jgi:Flp pilus assembly protein TadD
LNYADFYRAQNDDAAAEPLLNRASTLYPDSAGVHFALGLLRVRHKRTQQAVPELALPAKLSPGDSQFAYVYAVSLYTTGRRIAALSVLHKARERFPANTDISSAMQAYCGRNKVRFVRG